MPKTPLKTFKRNTRLFKTPVTPGDDDTLHMLAFNNSLQANIITDARSGKITTANIAASKLFGYSEIELLTKSRSHVFDIKERSFKKMLKERTAEGNSRALVTAIKKDGGRFHCEITSAVFLDKDDVERAITTITDLSESIFKQKIIDIEKDYITAANIAVIKREQIESDEKNSKIVAENIALALAKSDARLIENSEWIKYIAKTSYDVMFDWNVISGEIYVGESIQEVFGYKVQDNIVGFSDFVNCLLPDEKARVEKKLSKALRSRNKTWNDSYKFRRQDGSVATTTCRAGIVRDESGKAIRLIGAMQDVSKLQELEMKLENQISAQEKMGEIFVVAARLSYDVIWELNLLTNEGFIGEGFEQLFGYTVKNNKGNILEWNNHIHPSDKEAMQKGLQNALESSATLWEHAYRFVKADGSIARVFNRATIIRLADQKAYRMIGALQDISKQKMLEERLEEELILKGKLATEFRDNFRLLLNSSSDILYDVDLVIDEITVSNAFEKKLGYKITGKLTLEKDWLSHIHPGDKTAVIKDYLNTLASDATEWNRNYRFLRADNSVATILNKSIILRNNDGKAYRMIGFMYDSSEQKVLEEKLEQHIRLKERQISEAAQEAKDAVRSEIGKELHDNINQLLGASRLYLDLAKRGGGQSEMYLARSSEYTLTAIEEIRKLSKGLTTDILQTEGLCEAIETICRDTMEVHPVTIFSSLDSFIENRVNAKFKLTIFRIVQEQLNNILKHAKATDVKVGLSQNKKVIVLGITDNGVGFDTEKKHKGIGLENIKSRAAHYNATADFNTGPGKGCTLTIIFPVTAALLNKG